MRLSSIQILRAVAALMVTMYHIRAIEGLAIAEAGIVTASGAVEPGLLSGLWHNGFVGVDMFFVISGFVMVYATQQMTHGGRGAAEFLFARAGRIYPIWWFFASCMALYFLLNYGAPLDVVQAEQGGQSNLAHVLKSYFLIPQPVFPILGVGWTLVHEMYFYAVFAGFMLLPRRWLPVLLAIWALIVVGGTLANQSAVFAGNYLQLAVYPMTIEFILGAVTGLLVVSGRIWRPGVIAILAALSLVACMHFIISPEHSDGVWRDYVLQWGRVLMFGVPCAFLVFAAAGAEILGRVGLLLRVFAAAIGFGCGAAIVGSSGIAVQVGSGLLGAALLAAITYFAIEHMPSLSARLMAGLNALGDWSYSIYLCHMLVLSGLRRFLPAFADVLEKSLGVPAGAADLLRLGSAGPFDNILFVLLSLILTLIVSGLAYRLLERPAARWFARRRRQVFSPQAV